MRVRVSANPILIKELRGRMRGPRAYLFLAATLALLGAVTYGLYRLAVVTTQNAYGGVPQGALIGRGVFTGLVFVALMVICGVTPFLTAGAISGEHERKTMDLLLATPLSPSSLLWGKLVAALSYAALVLLATIPLASLSFVFGGVATEDMLKAFLLLLGFAVSFSVMGLFFSALFRRTGRALAASYLILALFVLGTMFAFVVNAMMGQQQLRTWLLAPNPFTAMASLLSVNSGSYPFGGFPGADILGGILGLVSGGPLRGVMVQRIPGGPLVPSTAPQWQQTAGFYAGLTAVLYLVSTRLVRPVRRFRLRARTWAIVALLLAAGLLAIPVVYGPYTPGRLVAWARWLSSSPRNLIAGAGFSAPLEEAWQVRAEPGSQVEQVEEDGRQAVRLARAAETPGEAALTQAIDGSVRADGWLQVRAVLRVMSQDADGCGMQGDACPLTLELTYDDADGRQHEWRQSFYITNLGSGPPFCATCETRQAPISLPVGEWYTYESLNLLQSDEATAEWMAMGSPYSLPPPPRLIRSVTIAAAGSSYEVEVAEVALISREGRPLPWGSGSDATSPLIPTEAPAFAVPMMGVAPVPPVPTAPLPVVVETAAPTPTPVPTATAEG